MKKIIFCCLMSSFLAANSYAQAVDLFDDDSLNTPSKNEPNAPQKPQALYEKSESAQNADAADENSGMLSFIKKPISLLFSADDKVAAPDGKEETFLEKSIRQANEGKLEDQMNLAYMYLYGTNGVKQDFAKAFDYYQMAAGQNDPIALNNLGSLYFNGIGTEANAKKAIEMFSKAAELGNDNAATNLAFIYLKGGVKDPARNKIAMNLFKKAAESGNNVAKFMTGYAYSALLVAGHSFTSPYRRPRTAPGR